MVLGVFLEIAGTAGLGYTDGDFGISTSSICFSSALSFSYPALLMGTSSISISPHRNVCNRQKNTACQMEAAT